jgi:hypothetical protein
MKFLKKILSIVSAMMHLPLANAGSMGSMYDLDNHPHAFYLAGSLGVVNLQDKLSITYNPESHQLSSSGILGGAYLGYDYAYTSQYHFAIEGFFDGLGVNSGLGHPDTSLKINQRYFVGVRLLPQYLFSSGMMAHWIFGYANGHFNLYDNGVYGYTNLGFNRNAFQTGFGFSTPINTNFHLRLDTYYNIYVGESNSALSTNPPNIQTYTNSFSNLIGEFSLVYRFNG